MFSADNRLSLLDAMRPPEGFRLSCAVGTTYSMDFVTLTAILLAFVDAEAEGGHGEMNTIDALRALTRLGTRVRVLVNRGYVQHKQEKRSTKLFALYDRIVQDVALPSGSFHPKVWLLRFQPKGVSDATNATCITRMLCSSRNATTSQNWELLASLDGEDTAQASSLGIQLRDYAKRVLMAANCHNMAAFTDLLNKLPRVKFFLPKEMQEQCEFLWQWPEGTPLRSHLPAKGKRAVIVSPFLGKTFLDDMLSRFDELTVVSTKEQFDTMDDDGFEALTGQKLFAVVPDSTDESSISMDLHGKLYICQSDSQTTLFLGSANATHSAWKKRNCEAVLAFSPGVAIGSFERQFLYRDKGILHGWISEYGQRDRQAREAETEEDKARKAVDRVHASVSRLPVHAHYDQDACSLRLRSPNGTEVLRGIAGLWPTPISIRLGLLALEDAGGQRQASLEDVFRDNADFNNVEVSDLTTFVIIAIKHDTAGLTKTCVLKAETNYENLLQSRDTALLKKMLDRDSFQRFLQAILFDGAGRSLRGTRTKHRKRVAGNGGNSWLDVLDASIEEVLESCAADLAKVDDISSLLATFRDTGYVAPDFQAFWNSVCQAVQQCK